MENLSIDGSGEFADVNFDILVIDNHDISRKTISNILSHAGYKIDVATHGKEGIDKLKKNTSYKLVVTELIMPYAGGFEVIDYVKNHLSIPVVVLSAIADESAINSIFNLKANDFLKKPFIAGELVQRIGRLMPAVTKSQELELEAY